MRRLLPHASDDIKALLITAVLHRQHALRLCAVIANGGQQAERRAKLARAVLDHIGADDVPVGVGSEGKAYMPQSHEFALPSVDAIDARRLVPGADLLQRTVQAAAPKSLTFVCISSLRDLADLIETQSQLVFEKVLEVAIQGGVQRDPDTGKWVPDQCALRRAAYPPLPAHSSVHGLDSDGQTAGCLWSTTLHTSSSCRATLHLCRAIAPRSVNNLFDVDAAANVYSFCLDRFIPMCIVGRNAVPLLPMQLAKSFAQRTNDPVSACEFSQWV